MRRSSARAFSLVEVLVVLVILALLATMAIPACQRIRENSERQTVEQNLERIAEAGQRYLLDSGTDSVTYPTLVDNGFDPVPSVAGETYEHLVVRNSGMLEVETNDGEVQYDY